MLRPLPIARDEFDRNQVQQAFYDSSGSVLAVAMLTWTVVDGDLSDAKPSGRSQNWHKAMQFAIEPNFLQDVLSVALEPTVVVVQLNPVILLTSQLKTRDGSTLCQGS